tara:strand:+ start:114 stop:452 length:339 start_codon:yes stop_codon:yes gene_type:complete
MFGVVSVDELKKILVATLKLLPSLHLDRFKMHRLEGNMCHACWRSVAGTIPLWWSSHGFPINLTNADDVLVVYLVFIGFRKRPVQPQKQLFFKKIKGLDSPGGANIGNRLEL